MKLPLTDRDCPARGKGEGYVAAAFFVVMLLLVPLPGSAALLETPLFADPVAKGALPPIDQRMPREPALAELETLGQPGGELRMLMSSPKDTRLMVVYG
jgi:peptide/nickel transport system substrate-binding protein